ncbi:hypothetical protein SDRG_15463 [Saprolegnia diclina VS20]|uniref:F-box domain-containing protein n=1 Tax=Saprolegnia diclina (strain VS20) TaxID=1156394 RepID=T0PMU4_SAPDV|nr:hypothetical protein SDRG_15463 [Saprolegnia diclina VS20]EQC26734.1 hypothetical protein SDRG_15463 [Saprolegnia diclina VS20]|eukprot:XP_008619858.1 hypothetical protein SDRG_15463 [Saprolegnia diclina VS20]
MLMHQPADTVVDAVALELVHWLSDLRDVVAFVSALPQPTPALAALLQLHQAIDLTQHWPCLNLQNIPKRHINVGIAALAAFPRVAVAPATNLRWLSAPLPRTTSVHMPLKSCNRTTLAFARAWGSSVRHVWVRNANALLPHVQEVLALCQHLDSADLLVSTATNAGLWVDALTRPACPFFALTVDISYMYASAAECMPLAQAILSSPSLRRLSLICNAAGIHDALLASKGDLHHVTKFCAVGMPAQPLIKKTDPAKLLNVLCSGTFDLWRCSALQCLSLTHGSLDWPRIATGCCPNLRFVTLFGTIADADMPLVAQWLSTSRVLRCVQTPSDSVGELGAQAMAGALPQWIARGLEMFRLGRNL